MAQPTPKGTPFTHRAIFVDASRKTLPNAEGAVGGEIIVTVPDGSTEHILFKLDPTPARGAGLLADRLMWIKR